MNCRPLYNFESSNKNSIRVSRSYSSYQVSYKPLYEFSSSNKNPNAIMANNQVTKWVVDLYMCNSSSSNKNPKCQNGW